MFRSVFRFFFFPLGKRQEARKKESRIFYLSLCLSKKHVLPVLRRQTVDLLFHRGCGLLRSVQCEVRKKIVGRKDYSRQHQRRRRYLKRKSRTPDAPLFFRRFSASPRPPFARRSINRDPSLHPFTRFGKCSSPDP